MSKPESETARRALAIAAADLGDKAEARRMGRRDKRFWRQIARLDILPVHEPA